MCVNSKRHPHADVIIAWAEGKPIQQMLRDVWCDVLVENPNFHSGLKFRIKPEPVEVITCNGVEITPMKEKPVFNSVYYIADVLHSELYGSELWQGDKEDLLAFSRGVVHSTHKSAIAHAKAMLKNKKELRDV